MTSTRQYVILDITYREKEYRYSVVLFGQLAYFIPLCIQLKMRGYDKGFYHAKIDAKGLKAGDSYHKLKNVAVILIMPFDPFGIDRMVYTIRNTCAEEPDMPYDDGAFTMFLYTRGQKGIPSVELKQFLTYFEQTTESNACNKDLSELHKMVSRVRMDEEVELEYMKIFEREEMIREEGIEQGNCSGYYSGTVRRQHAPSPSANHQENRKGKIL